MIEFFLIPLIIIYQLFIYIKRKFSTVTFLNKTVWITGASSGIGEAMTYKLADLGAILILSARREQELERVRSGCKNPDKVIIFPLDLSKPEEAYQKASSFLEKKELKVDVLINNSGVSMRSFFLETTHETEKEMMNINYFGPTLLARLVLPNMLKEKSGQIVLINSIAGKTGTPLRSSYCGSKHALNGFFDSVRAEYGDNGITVTSIHPGYVATAIAKNAFASGNEKFGKTDANIGGGMPPRVFAEKAVNAIFFKENETIITKDFKDRVITWLRNLWPDLVFYAISVYKKQDLKALEKAN